MSTTYAVDVTITVTPEGEHEGTCSCSCGWTLTTSAPTSQMATRIADRARANHFEDQHPDQRRYATQVVETHHGDHEPALGGSTKDGFLWARTIVCACAWEASVVGRTPLEAASLARNQHRHHERTASSRGLRGDHLVRLGALILLLSLIVALATYALHSAGS